MTQRALTHIYDVSISHWAARFLAGEQVAPWQCTRPFPAVHPNNATLSFRSSLTSINWPLDIFSTALPGIGGKAEANTNGAVAGAGVTPSSSASQAGEGSGREKVERPVERPEPDPPAEGMTPGSAAAKSNAPEWATERPTKEKKGGE